MKSFIAILCFALFIYSCESAKSPSERTSETSEAMSDTVRIANDSIEYEVIIIEPGFHSWLLNQPPKGYYGQDYMERRNRFFIAEYNRRVYSPNYDRDLYPQQINYDPQIDYGLEVNYLLYNYFKFFQEKYNQRLL